MDNQLFFICFSPHDHIGQSDGEATPAAFALGQEPDKKSRSKELFAMDDYLLDAADSEPAHSDVSTGSQSPTASMHHATSSCTSSDVSSTSDNISAVSSADEEEEDNLHNTFGALNEVEEDEEEEEDVGDGEVHEESSKHPVIGKCEQNANNELCSLEVSRLSHTLASMFKIHINIHLRCLMLVVEIETGY